ncbi:hypothetical protein AB0I82_04145 [Streptomyces sp. NPDC050315]|uniref:hypothetical protein n=1 Tax=Streptomyces sp. NPDC050315 TaxID=3155039 RepID=UPI00342B10B4
MKSLVGTIIAIVAFFILILFVFGSGFGALEISVWFAFVAALVIAIRANRKKPSQP